jgi:hypothetical protein
MPTQTAAGKKTNTPRQTAAHKGRAALTEPNSARPATHAGVGARRSDSALARRFGIDEANLPWRREFVRLTEEDAKLLAGLVDWASSNATSIACEFYDWQFAFPPTRAFLKISQIRGKYPFPRCANS